MTLRPELTVAQTLGEKAVYHIADLCRAAGSRSSAYRLLEELRETGFALQVKEGYFTIRSSLFQPFQLWSYLLPSLEAIRQARYFGLSYNENDVRLARRILHGTVTLDYRAYELTGLQEPHTLFLYVEDIEKAATTLRDHHFSEGTQGRVAILPRVGSFQNEIQRTYLDSIAYGGRSILDAIAIELLHSEMLDPKTRGTFRSENILKVREELSSLEPGTRSS